MATIAENLQTILDIKSNIKDAIIAKGVSVADSDSFATYASKIESIETGITSIDIGASGIKFAYSTFTQIPSIFDFSNVTNMSSMFFGCSKLTSVPLFYTSNVTNMYGMFNGCSSLTNVPEFDTSNVTNMSYMFSYCSSLTSVPLFNTSNVTNMENAFRNTISLNSIPQFDTSNVNNMSFLFYYSNIVTIPELNCESVKSMSSAFYNCKQLSYVGGFKNIGKYQSITEYQNDMKVWLPNSNLLTYESCMNIINNVYDMTSFDYRCEATIKFHATPYALLSAEDISIATSKGWSVVSA